MKTKRKLRWKATLHMSLDKCHESQFRSKYGGRDIAWIQITPVTKEGFGKPKNYFIDLSKDYKTRPEHRELKLLIAAIDRELATTKARKKK